jgi:hypothetical protein
MAQKEKILEFLSDGLKPSVVASALGISESYISQLLSSEEFSKELREKKEGKLTELVSTDKTYDRLEQSLQESLERMIPFMTNPSHVIRALQVTNSAIRKSIPSLSGSQTINTLVQINLPESAKVKFTMNSENQVIEVEGRPLATLPTNELDLDSSSAKDINRAKEIKENISKLRGLPPAELENVKVVGNLHELL